MEVLEALKRELTQSCPDLELRTEEPMGAHTTLRIGGPATLMALPRSADQVAAALRAAHRLGITPIFIGNGSNLLVADEGIQGFVLKSVPGLDGIRGGEDGRIQAQSGVSLARLAFYAMEHGLTGLEFAHGIPGSLGGAVTMNAGAYEGEMSQVVYETEFLNPDGTPGSVAGQAHQFSYRHSLFSQGERFLLGSKFVLRPGDKGEIQAKMQELAQRRRSKQPLEYPSAGSTFKRPVGHYAAALIEQCGLKGCAIGGAQVSEKHAGFLINKGGATCSDMLALIAKVQETVEKQTGVRLELEVKVLGQGG